MQIKKNYFIQKENIKKIKICCILIFFLFFLKVTATNVQISLNIGQGQITYGSPTYLDLGQINLAQTQQNIQGQFLDYFWVSDLQGSDNGYSTNIVCDGLVGANGVTLTGIYLMAGNNGVPELLNGVVGNVGINNVFSGNYYPIFDTPVTYIKRDQGSNFGKINKYGDKPWIRVVIPAFTQPGTYSGIIYFDI